MYGIAMVFNSEEQELIKALFSDVEKIHTNLVITTSYSELEKKTGKSREETKKLLLKITETKEVYMYDYEKERVHVGVSRFQIFGLVEEGYIPSRQIEEFEANHKISEPKIDIVVSEFGADYIKLTGLLDKVLSWYVIHSSMGGWRNGRAG